MKQKIKKLLKNMFSSRKEIVPIITPVRPESLLKGKVALVTGGSSGIGFSIAKALLESGCKVIISGTNQDKLAQATSKLSQECERAKFCGGGIRFSA